jgi:hypothetical protein
MFKLEKLPAPDEMGFFHHPDIPGEDESDDVKALCREMGFDAKGVDMESDAPDLSDRYGDDGDVSAVFDWNPTPPKGDGWMLVAKFDTEDGPHAMFVKPIEKVAP